jgi:hypothetical protein
MADKPTRRGWLKGLLGAIFGAGAAGAARGKPPQEAGPPALPVPPVRASAIREHLGRVTTYVYDAAVPLVFTSCSPQVTTCTYDAGSHGEVGRA